MKLRQPLQELTVSAPGESPHQNLLDVLKQEVNVKAVTWNSTDEIEVALDTTITPELQEEGDARELIRSIQRLRKKAGLQIGEPATVTAPSWPASFTQEIESKTDTTLTKGDTLALV